MKKNILCIIQARTGSKRFARKVLRKINGVTLLSLVIKRIALSSFIKRTRILVATTDKKRDNAIAQIVKQEKVKIFRGNENDVLDRYYKAAQKHSADIVIRITSDCPLIDYEIIDRAIGDFIKNEELDYCSNRLKPSYPEGLDTEIFTFRALERAWREAVIPYDREHATPYIYKSGKFRIKNMPFKKDFSYLHFSVDYKKDFTFIKAIYKSLINKGYRFVLKDILKVLADKPEILKINQKGAYKTFSEYIKN